MEILDIQYPSVETLVGIELQYSTTKETARDIFIQNLIINTDGKVMENYPFIFIDMPCGGKYIANTPNDFPTEDVKCSCGDPTHWFVRYNFIDIGLNG